MKHLLLFISLAFACPLISQDIKEVVTPEKPKEKFSMGLHVGLAVSNMPSRHSPFIVDGKSIKIQNEIAYFAGASARQPIDHQFAATLEVQFAVKGYKLPFPSGINRYRFHYLDIIPQVEYKLFNNLHFSLGGYWGWRVEERVKVGENQWAIINPDYVQFVEDTDFGLVSGLTIRFEKVFALIRYQYGLAPVSALKLTDENGQPIGTQGLRNRSLQIGLGFKIL